MVHAKNEVPATANNAEINIFNFSFILLSFIWARGVSYRKLHRITHQCGCLFYFRGAPPFWRFSLSFLVEKVELL